LPQQRKKPTSATTGIDANVIRELAHLLDETGLSEIEIEHEGRRVKVVRQLAAQVTAVKPAAAAAVPVEAPPANAATAPADLSQHPGAVLSPMVGTAYLAPEPGAEPFVKVGDTVEKGATLLIIDAMKTMNPIPAPHSGKVTELLVTNEAPVEYGQPLMLIE
jgi:acetyl-CoA carboxylase biotin carboxyl carrier protein